MDTSSSLSLPDNLVIVGCGGIGSWMFRALASLDTEHDIHLYDADTVEMRNLDRQFFCQNDIGKNKAQALCEWGSKTMGWDGGIQAHKEWFQPSTRIPVNSLILCCADNMPARLASIQAADECQGTAIIGGNEFTDSDAYIYAPSLMRETANDPRVWMGDQIHDHSGDPTAPAGCTGQAQEAAPQLIIANIAAATYMLQLLWWWFAHRFQLDKSTLDYWPVLHRSSASRHQTILYGDRLKPQTTP